MEPPAKPLSSALIKPAGADCNIACTYCFYLEKGTLFSGGPVHRMSDAVLEETVRQIMTQGGRELSFGWQGGEPTLMGREFFEKAVEYQKKHGRSGQTVGNGLQTNGLLIDKAWSEFLRDARFLVGLSLDGPQRVHDRYRMDRGGRPTWSRVMKALRLMLENEVDVNAVTVVNDYSARFPEAVYEFHKDSGLRFMQFIPCVELDPSDPEEIAPFSVKPDQFGRFLCEVFDCWVRDFKRGAPTTFVRWFDALFSTYVGLPPAECTLQEECGSYVVIEHNGDVFSCDFFVEEKWKLGNLMQGNLLEMLNAPKQQAFGRLKADLPEICRSCRWRIHCRGGCTKDRSNGRTGENSPYLCEAYKMFFAHADSHLRRLADQWMGERLEGARRRPMDEGHARGGRRPGRNDPCPCGSGEKYKRCCGK
jgi:uncharacterized protein